MSSATVERDGAGRGGAPLDAELDGWVECDRPATLPTVLLGPRAGRLSPATLDQVDAALRFVLDL